MCYPVIWTNLVTAIKGVDKKLLEMSKVYKVKKSVVFKKVYIPSVLPYFAAACITCLGLGWKVSVAAEVLSHPRNAIGSNLHSAKAYLDSTELFAWTFVVILLSFIFEIVFSKMIKTPGYGGK
jgi:NitT/TauT family transport system permease protein